MEIKLPSSKLNLLTRLLHRMVNVTEQHLNKNSSYATVVIKNVKTKEGDKLAARYTNGITQGTVVVDVGKTNNPRFEIGVAFDMLNNFVQSVPTSEDRVIQLNFEEGKTQLFLLDIAIVTNTETGEITENTIKSLILPLVAEESYPNFFNYKEDKAFELPIGQMKKLLLPRKMAGGDYNFITVDFGTKKLESFATDKEHMGLICVNSPENMPELKSTYNLPLTAVDSLVSFTNQLDDDKTLGLSVNDKGTVMRYKLISAGVAVDCIFSLLSTTPVLVHKLLEQKTGVRFIIPIEEAKSFVESVLKLYKNAADSAVLVQVKEKVGETYDIEIYTRSIATQSKFSQIIHGVLIEKKDDVTDLKYSFSMRLFSNLYQMCQAVGATHICLQSKQFGHTIFVTPATLVEGKIKLSTQIEGFLASLVPSKEV